ncbi:hypothetical protein HPP92_010641 [Vanilla planifolia]|uniref:N-acetyltransferase domain-containing protein n=1 Tax=Vanilla planifolia TaxID=51239 RepID=A0A835V211_VANPL|nr:hypothetical protein HPP92_010641 [Vanilla planifolia]
MAAGSPTFLALPLVHDPSLRTLLTSSTTCSSISLYRANLPFSLSHTRSTAGAIDASSSAGGVFLDNIGLHRLQTLEKYIREDELDGGGWLEIRHMEDSEVDPTVMLLSDSYAETMGVPQRYVPLLSFFVKQYLVERRSLVPHAAMLVGFYRDSGVKEPELACTAEVSFDSRGANAAPPTPLPPSDFPYICNMAVKKALRRKGIARRLLKACEELISLMKTNKRSL